MSNIHIGWYNTSKGQLGNCQLVSPSQLAAVFTSVECAERYAAQMNALEEQGGDEWFVLVGDPVCQKPCADCDTNTELHHWLYDATDEDDEGVYPDGRMNCKHCETWRTVVDNDE